jgi:alkylated DNA repair dioxygenase AlkB
LIPQSKANQYLSELLENIDWKNDQTIIFGKLIITKRKVAWYGDKNFSYTYSNTTKEAMPWTPALLELKSLAEATTGETYNSCLLNLYHDGNEGMGWHSDAEKDLVMKDETQTHWLHRLPPTRLVIKARVNLTFRTIIVKD